MSQCLGSFIVFIMIYLPFQDRDFPRCHWLTGSPATWCLISRLFQTKCRSMSFDKHDTTRLSTQITPLLTRSLYSIHPLPYPILLNNIRQLLHHHSQCLPGFLYSTILGSLTFTSFHYEMTVCLISSSFLLLECSFP